MQKRAQCRDGTLTTDVNQSLGNAASDEEFDTDLAWLTRTMLIAVCTVATIIACIAAGVAAWAAA